MDWSVVKVGVKNLLLHKLRSLLTLLGVILGVGSVIAMLAVGEGSKKEALERIRKLGANNVIIRSVKPNVEGERRIDSSNQNDFSERQMVVHEYGLKHEDLERLKSTLPTITRAVPVALVNTDASREQLRIPGARILGTTPEFLEIKDLKVGRGRFVTSVDINYAWNVAVLSAGAARRLFQFVDPLEKTVWIGDDVYRVVGVLRPQNSGNNTPGALGQNDLNEDIYIPLTCVQRRLGELQEVGASGGENLNGPNWARLR